jgi:hypothetical protein
MILVNSYQYVSTDDCWMQWKDKVKSPRGVRSLLT